MAIGPHIHPATGSRPERPGHAAGALQAHLLLLVACLPIMGMLVVAPVLPDIERHFGSVSGIAYLAPLILTAPALSIVILSPIVGRMAAAFGRRPLLIAALVLYVSVATAPLYLTTIPTIIATRLAVGASEAVLMTVSTMLIGDYFEGPRRERYLSMQVIYTSVSAMLFLLLGGVLGQMGWRAPFVAYLAPVVLLPLVIRHIPEPASPVTQEVSDLQVPWRLVIPICIVTFFAGGCMNLMSVELGYLVEAVGGRDSLVKGAAAAVNSAGIAIGAAVMAFYGSAGRRWQLSATLLLAALGYHVVFNANQIETVIVGGALVGLGSGFYLGWLLATLNRALGFGNRGRAIGAWMSSYFLATVLAPVAAVGIAGPAGGLQRSMGVFGVVLVVLAATALILRDATSDRPSSPREAP